MEVPVWTARLSTSNAATDVSLLITPSISASPLGSIVRGPTAIRDATQAPLA
jgi:hypothetical protein